MALACVTYSVSFNSQVVSSLLSGCSLFALGLFPVCSWDVSCPLSGCFLSALGSFNVCSWVVSCLLLGCFLFGSATRQHQMNPNPSTSTSKSQIFAPTSSQRPVPVSVFPARCCLSMQLIGVHPNQFVEIACREKNLHIRCILGDPRLWVEDTLTSSCLV